MDQQRGEVVPKPVKSEAFRKLRSTHSRAPNGRPVRPERVSDRVGHLDCPSTGVRLQFRQTRRLTRKLFELLNHVDLTGVEVNVFKFEAEDLAYPETTARSDVGDRLVSLEHSAATRWTCSGVGRVPATRHGRESPFSEAGWRTRYAGPGVFSARSVRPGASVERWGAGDRRRYSWCRRPLLSGRMSCRCSRRLRSSQKAHKVRR